MATEADMIAKISAIPLDPDTVILSEAKQDLREYWVLTGNVYTTLPDGTKRVLQEMSFQEPKT